MAHLVVIDGGRGQLNAVRRFSRPWIDRGSRCCRWQKGQTATPRETLFMPDASRSSSSRAIRAVLIQRLRDEAHRFVIVAPQAAQKDIREAGLQENPASGPPQTSCCIIRDVEEIGGRHRRSRQVLLTGSAPQDFSSLPRPPG